MQIFFEEIFEKDLRKSRDKKLLNKVKEVIEEVRVADYLKEIRNLEKLRGHKTYYRIRIGNYRIGIEIISNKVIFTRFLHRKEVYKYFP